MTQIMGQGQGQAQGEGQGQGQEPWAMDQGYKPGTRARGQGPGPSFRFSMPSFRFSEFPEFPMSPNLRDVHEIARNLNEFEAQ